MKSSFNLTPVPSGSTKKERKGKCERLKVTFWMKLRGKLIVVSWFTRGLRDFGLEG